MVGTFDQPDFQTDTGTAYKTAIDNSIAVVGALAGQFAAHEQSSPNMTVRVDAGKLLSGTTLTSVAAQNTGTITAPVGNPRIDRVVINASTGVVSVITGTPAVSPTPPAITSGNIPIAQVALTPSTTAITNAIITDERPVSFSGGVSDGDKGDITVSGGGGTWTLDKNATLQTVSGSVSTKLTTLQTIASASTTNLGSITNSNIISITGTTTITSFGSSADVANPLYFIRFTGALTLTHNGTSLILPASANITTAAGDAAIMEYLGSGNWRCLNYQRANGQALASSGGVRIQSTTYTTNTTLSTTIPADDTIPQNTEGTEIMTISFTPVNASSTIEVYWEFFGSVAAGAINLSAVLFKDSTANALKAAVNNAPAAGTVINVSGSFTESAGSTSARTYRIRVGATGNVFANGTAGATRLYGGVLEGRLTVKEILP